ncbi:MAG: hypothetical protein LV473_16875 [Nitrospira sp.]|nr:hypothetical protein [Nitrospira sp.]
MTKTNQSNGFSRTSIHKYPFLRVPPSNTSCEAKDFQEKVAEEVVEMCRNELAVDVPQDFDDVDFHDHIIREPDDSQLLTVEPPLTLSKICSKLTAIERLWLARMVKTHGKELVLARWPAYEVHINYVRYLL